jgi:hypothetical protein
MPESKTRTILFDTLSLISSSCEEIKTFPVYSSDIFPNKILNVFNRGLRYTGLQALITPEKNKDVVSESIVLFNLLLKRSKDFDDVREMLQDNNSRIVFEWVPITKLLQCILGWKSHE